ncbi:MAG: histidinol-phosphate transaminase [Caldimonas sp.]
MRLDGAASTAGRAIASTDERIAAVVRQDVKSMHAYAIQQSAGLVKLDAMENPFRLPEALQDELGRQLGRVAINRYPTTCVADVVSALSSYVKLPAGCKLMLGNGSDELISLLALACDLPGATILAPLPGFVMYEMSAKLQGLRFVGVPLTPRFELDEAAMLAAIQAHRPAITYIAYPNNPTANLFDEAVVERIVAAIGKQNGLVVFDEAYQPFSSRSWMSRVGTLPHVLVMRTLSKFGLAGVRLGYLAGPAALVDEIDKVRPPYNISALNAEATLFALEHANEFARQAALLRGERERLQRALRDLPGVEAFPSEANMILVRVANGAAVFAGMKQRGVLVKNVAGLHPSLANCLRLTVGTPEENTLMIDALHASLP